MSGEGNDATKAERDKASLSRIIIILITSETWFSYMSATPDCSNAFNNLAEE
jgi:hypothetical protein